MDPVRAIAARIAVVPSGIGAGVAARLRAEQAQDGVGFRDGPFDPGRVAQLAGVIVSRARRSSRAGSRA